LINYEKRKVNGVTFGPLSPGAPGVPGVPGVPYKQHYLENNPKQIRALIGLNRVFYNSIKTQN